SAPRLAMRAEGHCRRITGSGTLPRSGIGLLAVVGLVPLTVAPLAGVLGHARSSVRRTGSASPFSHVRVRRGLFGAEVRVNLGADLGLFDADPAAIGDR